MEHRIDRLLGKQEIRQLLDDRQEGNVVHLFRNVTVPGSSPGLLAWLQKEHNPDPETLKDTFAVYGGRYTGRSLDIDAATDFVDEIASSSYSYTGPKTLQ
jgi:hypothetical protein